MNVVLLGFGYRLSNGELRRWAPDIAAAGHKVHLVAWRWPELDVHFAFDTITVLGPSRNNPPVAEPEESSDNEELAAPSELGGLEMPGDPDTANGESDDANSPVIPQRPRLTPADGLVRYVTFRLRAASGWRYRKYRRRFIMAQRRLRRRIRRPVLELLSVVSAAIARHRARHDPRVAGLLESADVVVAVDAPSIFTVWRLTRERADVQGISGLSAFAASLGTSQSAN